MSNDEVLKAEQSYVAGTKQTTRAVEMGKAEYVIVAKDADPRITNKIINLCKKTGIQVKYMDSMKQLGKKCGIEVGAAMVAVLQNK